MWYKIAKIVTAAYFKMPNKFKKPCANAKCKKPVFVGEGWAVSIDGEWYTFHKECYSKYEQSTPDTLGDEKAKGTVIVDPANPNAAIVKFPFDQEIKEAVKALTRPKKVYPIFVKNDPKHGSHWRISIDSEDIAYAVQELQELDFEIDPLILERVSKESHHSEIHKKSIERGLYEYQAQDAEWLANRKYALLAHDMGLGKTAITLMALPRERGALVICPKLIITNWIDEIKKWAPDLKPVPVYNKASFVFPQIGEVVITNYESIPEKFTPGTRDGRYCLWDSIDLQDRKSLQQISVIVDEAHFVKNPKAKRTGKVGAITHNAASAWLLTGTPLANKPLDLWTVLDVGNMAQEVFTSFSNFLKLMNGYKTRYGIQFGTPSSQVPKLLKKAMRRRKKEDVLQIPQKRYIDRLIDIENQVLIKEMDDLFKELYEKTEGDVAKFIDKLPSFEEFSRIRKELANEKFKYAIQIVEEYEEANKPLVVFCCHVKPVIELGNRPGWEAVHGQISAEKRGEIVRRFQNKELKGIALTTTAGGIGINLTASDTVLFIDMAWRPSDNMQAEDRICRIGQESDSITIIRIIANHALDRHICRLLSIKQKWIQDSIEKAVTKALQESTGDKSEEEILEETVDQLDQVMPEETIRQMAKEKADDTLADGEQGIIEESRESLEELIERRKAEQTKAKEAYGGQLELTDERKALILQALSYLRARCDGAFRIDNVGFNKYDANKINEMLRRIRSINELTDKNFRFLQLILQKYRDTQLGEEYYSIWSPTPEEIEEKEREESPVDLGSYEEDSDKVDPDEEEFDDPYGPM